MMTRFYNNLEQERLVICNWSDTKIATYDACNVFFSFSFLQNQNKKHFTVLKKIWIFRLTIWDAQLYEFSSINCTFQYIFYYKHIYTSNFVYMFFKWKLLSVRRLRISFHWWWWWIVQIRSMQISIICYGSVNKLILCLKRNGIEMVIFMHIQNESMLNDVSNVDSYVCAKELRALSTQFSHNRTNIDFFLQSQLLHQYA